MTHDFRPEMHFAPRKGWINDPNGLLYRDGQYHLFAQHNPDATVWGPMHWLHATGTDLTHWREEGIALWPDALGTMFSGSAVNLPDGRIGLMYTAHGEKEQQCAAFSNDGMRFEKSVCNPVIANDGARDFRDPKVFWNDRYGCWSVAIARMDEVVFYRSPDLLQWTKTGAFALEDERFGFGFECPDLFPLTAPDGTRRWILTASMMFHKPEYGCHMQYFIGDFDGDAFRRDPAYGTLRPDAGYDCYAGASFYGARERLWMAWMARASCPLPSKEFCGMMTLARRWTLADTPQGLRVAQECALDGAQLMPFCHGDALPEGPFVADVKADGPFELALCDERGESCLTVGLDAENRLYTARAQSPLFAGDSAYNDDRRRLTSAPRVYEGGTALRLVCDAPCVELFADQGVYAHAMLVYPQGKLCRYTARGAASVELCALR